MYVDSKNAELYFSVILSKFDIVFLQKLRRLSRKKMNSRFHTTTNNRLTFAAGQKNKKSPGKKNLREIK